jgi:hypothetical protein
MACMGWNAVERIKFDSALWQDSLPVHDQRRLQPTYTCDFLKVHGGRVEAPIQNWLCYYPVLTGFGCRDTLGFGVDNIAVAISFGRESDREMIMTSDG